MNLLYLPCSDFKIRSHTHARARARSKNKILVIFTWFVSTKPYLKTETSCLFLWLVGPGGSHKLTQKSLFFIYSFFLVRGGVSMFLLKIKSLFHIQFLKNWSVQITFSFLNYLHCLKYIHNFFWLAWWFFNKGTVLKHFLYELRINFKKEYFLISKEVFLSLYHLPNDSFLC